MDGKFSKGNPGKPKGAVNKSTKQVKDIFAEAFTELQKDSATKLTAWGKKNLTEFYKLSSKLIPLQLTGDPDNPIRSELTVTVVHSNGPISESEDQVQ